MHELTLLQDMAIVMAISAAVTVLCHRFHVPVVLGYILAGLIIGPHTPPFPLIRDIVSIRTLSELGVIFLLFGIGLEFSLTKLMRVGVVSLVAATLEIALMAWIGFAVGQAFGWSFMDSLFLGAILSVSSTTIIAKVLLDTKKLHATFAQVILGILVIEDVLAIIIIALLSGLAATGALTLAEAGMATLQVGAFVAGVLLLGMGLVPRLLRYLERFQSAELLVVTTLGLCFGLSLLAAKLGFSVALGAFLIGAVIAETPQAKNVIRHMEPIRDMFTAIFFVSVGMLLDPKVLAAFAWPIAAITLVTILGKVFSCSLATFLTGYPPETALRVGLGLAQIGEFSFIIARLGESTQVTSSFLYPIAVSVSGVTTLTTPLLMRNTERIVGWVTRWAPRPLVTLGSLYAAWLERLKHVPGGPQGQHPIWEGLRSQLPRLGLYLGGALTTLVLAARFAPHMPLPSALYGVLVGIVLFALFFAVAQTVDRILWDVLRRNLRPGRFGALPAREREKEAALHHLLRFLVMVFCSLALWSLGALFVPLASLSVAVVMPVALASLVLWGSARRLHERLERVVLQLFDKEQPEQTPQWQQSHDALVQLIREQYPWEVQTQDLLLPYQESAANQTIGQLRLRTQTGASIVAIYREGEAMVNPSLDTLLMPGDVVLLMGSPEQIQAGMRYLGEKMRQPLPRHEASSEALTRRFAVPPGSQWAGKTVAQLDLRRRTQVQIVGLQKAETSITNPGPEVVIEAGDVLILFGRADQLAQAEAYLAGGGSSAR